MRDVVQPRRQFIEDNAQEFGYLACFSRPDRDKPSFCGKRTAITEYRLQSRAGKVVSVLSVTEDSEVMIISQQGKTTGLDSSGIRESGRSVQGVRLEIFSGEVPRALDPAMTSNFVQIFKALGSKFVRWDLEGFGTGSQNTRLVKLGH